jgi:hypothetical protein
VIHQVSLRLLSRRERAAEVLGDAAIELADGRGATAAHGREALGERATSERWTFAPAGGRESGAMGFARLASAIRCEFKGEE